GAGGGAAASVPSLVVPHDPEVLRPARNLVTPHRHVGAERIRQQQDRRCSRTIEAHGKRCAFDVDRRYRVAAGRGFGHALTGAIAAQATVQCFAPRYNLAIRSSPSNSAASPDSTTRP